jgi:hypothetical protein
MMICVLIMEMCLASMLVGWLWVVVAVGAWPVPFVGLLPAVGGLAAGKLIPYPWRRMSWFDAAWWGIVSIVVAFLAELGNVYAAGRASNTRWALLFVFGLILAWRGWVIAEGWLDREAVETELQAGTIAVFILDAILAWQVPGAGLVPTLVFFTAGLIGLGIARRSERRGPRATAEADWLVLVGVMMVVLLIVCSAIVLLVTPELVTSMAQQALSIVGLGVRGLGVLIAWLGSFLPQGNPPLESTLPAGGAGGIAPVVVPPTSNFDSPPSWIFEVFLTLLGVIVLAMGIRIAFRNLPRRIVLWQRPPKEPGPPVSEAPDFSWGGWWRLLLAWFVARLRSPRTSSSASSGRSGGAGSAEAPREQRSIRALYRDLLSAAERAGFDRTPATTPAELAGSMTQARPTVQAPMSALTDLYVRARYGEEAAGRDEVNRMRSAVERVRQELAQSARNGDVNGQDRSERRPRER